MSPGRLSPATAAPESETHLKLLLAIVLAIMGASTQGPSKRAHARGSRDTATVQGEHRLCELPTVIDGATWCLTLGQPDSGAHDVVIAAALWNPQEKKFVRDSLGFAIVRFFSYKRVN